MTKASGECQLRSRELRACQADAGPDSKLDAHCLLNDQLQPQYLLSAVPGAQISSVTRHHISILFYRLSFQQMDATDAWLQHALMLPANYQNLAQIASCPQYLLALIDS